MLKSFIWTAIFWSLFTITNSVGDAIDFMERFPWYGNSWLWHFLKYWWIGFAVLTGVFALRLWMNIKYSVYREPKSVYFYFKRDIIYEQKEKYRLRATLTFAFLLLWFLALRWILFEKLLEKWSQL